MPKPPVQPLVPRDQLALVGDADLRRADRCRDAQPRERDRDRVAVLANGHKRLAVDAHRRDLGAIERPGVGQRAQQRAFVSELVGDRRRPALNAPREILLAGVTQHHVQLRHRPDRRDGNEVVAAQAPDLASTPPFSCAPCSPTIVKSALKR